MSGPQGVRTGETARLCEALGGGAMSPAALATATGVKLQNVNRRLRQRAAIRGDVELVEGLWRICKVGLPPPRKAAVRKAKRVKVRQGDAAVKARAEYDVVCEVAGNRTYTAPPGTWTPPRMVIRAGAFDYLDTPTRVGDQRLPYRGATNMSTTAMAAGARSGVK